MTDNMKTSVSREIPASAQDIFDVLSNPGRHVETDASGMVRGLDQGDRLQAVGDTFTMNMHKADGDYQTENEVFALVDGRAIGWKNLRNTTAGVEVGAKWLYELEPVDAERTNVTLTYDRSDIDNPDVLALSQQFDEAALEPSLAKLAESLS